MRPLNRRSFLQTAALSAAASVGAFALGTDATAASAGSIPKGWQEAVAAARREVTWAAAMGQNSSPQRPGRASSRSSPGATPGAVPATAASARWSPPSSRPSRASQWTGSQKTRRASGWTRCGSTGARATTRSISPSSNRSRRSSRAGRKVSGHRSGPCSSVRMCFPTTPGAMAWTPAFSTTTATSASPGSTASSTPTPSTPISCNPARSPPSTTC